MSKAKSTASLGQCRTSYVACTCALVRVCVCVGMCVCVCVCVCVCMCAYEQASGCVYVCT